MAANAVLRIQLRAQRLLVAQGDFVQRDLDPLSGRIPRAGDDSVSPGLLPKRDGGCDLPTGVGQGLGRSKHHAG